MRHNDGGNRPRGGLLRRYFIVWHRDEAIWKRVFYRSVYEKITVFTAAYLSENFIQAYVVPERLSGEAMQNGYLRLAFAGRTLRNTETDAAVRSEYDRLSAQYRDDSYDGYMVPHSTEALGVVCSAIEVVCDRAFDGTHAPGASLGDLTKVCAVSFRDFIAGGYDRTSAGADFPAEFDGLGFYDGPGAAPLFAKLTELEPDDLTLIGPEFYLCFTQRPEPGSYRFTVTVRTESGDLQTEVEADFE